SAHNSAAHDRDPDNRLLWRMNRRRLEVETWRDAVLAVSGQLDPALGGPSSSLDKLDNHRRTIYGTISRQKVADVLRLFDFPDAKSHTETRLLTTTPLQQLYLLNSPFLQQHAAALAAVGGAVPTNAKPSPSDYSDSPGGHSPPYATHQQIV